MRIISNIVLVAIYVIVAPTTILAQQSLKGKVSADSVTILSPHVEVSLSYERSKKENAYDVREKTAKIITDQLKSLLNKEEFTALPLMHKSYREVNMVLESYYPLYEFKVPPKMPQEVITHKTQYSLLITLYNNYSNPEVHLITSLINNRTKYRSYYHRIKIRDDSEDSAYMRNVLKGVLNKLILPKPAAH